MTRELVAVMAEQCRSGERTLAETHDERQGNADNTTLTELDNFAIDTGIPDLAAQHDHYLYGFPKKDVKEGSENENPDKI
jgi:hypothetical protein